MAAGTTDNPYSEIILDLIKNTPTQSAVILTDPENRVILWNKGAEMLLGYKAVEFIGQECLVEYRPVVQRTMALNGLKYAETETDSYSYRTNIATKEGKILSVQIIASRKRNRDGEIQGHLFIIYDITDYVVQEKFRLILVALAQISLKRQPMDRMLEHCTAAIQNHLELPFVYLCINENNEGFHVRSFTGGLKDGFTFHCACKPSEGGISGKCRECFNEKAPTCEELNSQLIWNRISSIINCGEPMYIVHAPLMSDSGIIGILHFVVPGSLKKIYTEENQILGLIASKVASAILTRRLEEDLQHYADNLEMIVEERTAELRKKDAQIVQSGKLATLGEMATGIAHEINQPLGGISLITQGIIKALHKGKLTDSMLEERLVSINEQIERINKIINHLRTFGHQAPESLVEVIVNKTIMDVFDFIGQQLKNRKIITDIDLDENLPPVLAESNRLEQVILNIIGNARDALDEQEIRVQDLLSKGDPPEWALSWEKRIYIRTYRDHNMVVIAIGDTGGGIDESIRDKIFEPFFTTKEVGEGTGLGLSISYGIIKEFKGDIKLVTEVDRGSTFFISIPVLEAGNKKC